MWWCQQFGIVFSWFWISKSAGVLHVTDVYSDNLVVLLFVILHILFAYIVLYTVKQKSKSSL